MDNSQIEKVIKSQSVYIQWLSMTHSIQYTCIAKAKYIVFFWHFIDIYIQYSK